MGLGFSPNPCFESLVSMSNIPDYFRLSTDGFPSLDAVVQEKFARFTILADCLIRIEYDLSEQFIDQASQVFWYRKQPVPSYEKEVRGSQLRITTKYLQLTYQIGETFRRDTLEIALLSNGTVWHYGDQASCNLLGTARTLDNVHGATTLEHGLLARSGWTVIDDSSSLVFNDEGWLEERRRPVEAIDVYFWGYGSDYERALNIFYRVSGNPGLIPRWALGNWWSRYWEYSQEELTGLMEDFKRREVPLSVCIVDMDWHLTKTGNKSSGWTGYTWNRELFPDPPGFIRGLHKLGLKTALNLHPAEGVHSHEARYPEIAAAMGIDPSSKKPVRFEPEDPNFVRHYFDILHHPEEIGGPLKEDGVDFWWMDWQQGNPSKSKTLNLLWWINHIHYLDLGRSKERRPFVFSRWGGLGNHRYPIGFSGDTVVSWESLAFQPYFTATAANVGYGWWSHDIGGHMQGVEDPELYLRWVQFGVFSPILRLHSTKNKYQDRRPWAFGPKVFESARTAFQLRHAFIPYIYSMAWRDRNCGAPLVRPMYHGWPHEESAYACPGQYMFGSELVAAPYVKPLEKDTGLSRQVIWLPDGNWFEFNGPGRYAGGWHALHGTLDEIPVFARAGAIIPLDGKPEFGRTDLPKNLEIHVFPGENGSLKLYEDDGETQAYLKGDFVETQIRQTWDESQALQTIHIEPNGNIQILPVDREYSFALHGLDRYENVEIKQNNTPYSRFECAIDERGVHWVTGLDSNAKDHWEINIYKPVLTVDEWSKTVFLKLLRHMRIDPGVKQALENDWDSILENPAQFEPYLLHLGKKQARALLEVIFDAGFAKFDQSGKVQWAMWNNRELDFITYSVVDQFSFIHQKEKRFSGQSSRLPKAVVITPDEFFVDSHRKRSIPGMVQIDFGTMLKIREVKINLKTPYQFPKAGIS